MNFDSGIINWTTIKQEIETKLENEFLKNGKIRKLRKGDTFDYIEVKNKTLIKILYSEEMAFNMENLGRLLIRWSIEAAERGSFNLILIVPRVECREKIQLWMEKIYFLDRFLIFAYTVDWKKLSDYLNWGIDPKWNSKVFFEMLQVMHGDLDLPAKCVRISNSYGLFEVNLRSKTVTFWPANCVDCPRDKDNRKGICVLPISSGWSNSELTPHQMAILALVYAIKNEIFDRITENQLFSKPKCNELCPKTQTIINQIIVNANEEMVSPDRLRKAIRELALSMYWYEQYEILDEMLKIAGTTIFPYILECIIQSSANFFHNYVDDIIYRIYERLIQTIPREILILSLHLCFRSTEEAIRVQALRTCGHIIGETPEALTRAEVEEIYKQCFNTAISVRNEALSTFYTILEQYPAFVNYEMVDGIVALSLQDPDLEVQAIAMDVYSNAIDKTPQFIDQRGIQSIHAHLSYQPELLDSLNGKLLIQYTINAYEQLIQIKPQSITLEGLKELEKWMRQDVNSDICLRAMHVMVTALEFIPYLVSGQIIQYLLSQISSRNAMIRRKALQVGVILLRTRTISYITQSHITSVLEALLEYPGTPAGSHSHYDEVRVTALEVYALAIMQTPHFTILPELLRLYQAYTSGSLPLLIILLGIAVGAPGRVFSLMSLVLFTHDIPKRPIRKRFTGMQRESALTSQRTRWVNFYQCTECGNIVEFIDATLPTTCQQCNTTDGVWWFLGEAEQETEPPLDLYLIQDGIWAYIDWRPRRRFIDARRVS